MRLILLFEFLFLFLSCTPKPSPQESCNFVQNSNLQRVSWKSSLPINLYINTSVPASYHDAIKSAAQVWNDKLKKNMFNIIDNATTPDYSQDSRSVVYWEPNWTSESTTQARTTIYWVDTQIIETDIKINAKDYNYSSTENTPLNQIDFESLIIHEFGHALGLIHILNLSSVMEPSLATGQDRRIPTSTDLVSLHCEY